MCTVLLPPAGNPIAVNKYININIINTNGCKKYILNAHNNVNDICRKCWEKWETIQHVIGACHTLAHGSYTRHHNQEDNIICL